MIKKKERLLELVDLSLDDPFITNDLSVSVHDTSYEAYVASCEVFVCLTSSA